MQNEKHVVAAVKMYVGLLFVFGVINLIKDVDYLDIVYLISLSCCIIKYMMIKRR